MAYTSGPGLTAGALMLSLLSGLPWPSATARVRAELSRMLFETGHLVVRERIDRYQAKGAKTHKLDSFEAVGEVVDGVENYSAVRGRGREYYRVGDIPGLWSFGEIATLLKGTSDAIGGDSDVCNAGPAKIVSFHSPGEMRRWFLDVGSQLYWPDFDGNVTIDAVSGEVARIEWRSDRLPPQTGVARIRWVVKFQPVEVGGRRYVLPNNAVYEVTRMPADTPTEWNITSFLQYLRYGSESTLRFER